MMSNGYLVAAIALSFEGTAKGTAKHKHILDVYNSVKPHGYTMRASDPWCAAFWTACQIMAGNTDVPMSASCSQIIADAKRLGQWVENDATTPLVGWGVLYDWSDGTNYANYDNQGDPDHIGIVYDVDDLYIYVIEGNKGNGVVGKRAVKKNGRFLRGFVKPTYKALRSTTYGPSSYFIGKVPTKDVKYGDSGVQVRLLQKFLNYILGLNLAIDGECGKDTTNAILVFQKTYGLGLDGWFGVECRQKGRAMLINFNAIAYAWPKGTDASKYRIAKGGKPDPDFKKAWKKIYNNSKWNCGCHTFVKLVLKSSGYGSMSLKWSSILKFLKANFTQKKVNYKMSQLKPGDIRVHKNSKGGYHIWVIVEIDGKLCRAEANQGGSNQRYAHITTSNKGNLKKHRKDWLFRAK